MSILLALSAAYGSVPVVHDVIVTDTGFDPPVVEVTEGDSVRWVFLGTVPQSATASAGQADFWDSGLLQPNLFFETVFTIAGQFNYYDQTFGADDGMGGALGVAGEVFVHGDTDGDGLSDADEQGLGTNPNKVDTDNDGLDDWDEVVVRLSDPLDDDTDNDGLNDGNDVAAGASPIDPDTDADGLDDFQEVAVFGTLPFLSDTDTGGLGDGDEVAMGLDPLNPADDGLLGPPGLTLIGAATNNGVNKFHGVGFLPIAKVRLMISSTAGSAVVTIGGCTTTTDLGGSPKFPSFAKADASGDVKLLLPIQKPTFHGTFHVQAVDVQGCILSDALSVTIP